MKSSIEPRDDVIWRWIAGMMGIGILFYLLIQEVRLHDGSRPEAGDPQRGSCIGWLGAASASLLFGSVYLPYSLKSLDVLDPVVRGFFITTFGSFGNSMANFAVIFLMRLAGLVAWRLNATQLLCGLAAACIVNFTAALAFFASRYAGVATAAPVLSSCGMMTSFVWGIAVFNEEVNGYLVCCFGLLGLMAGATLCSVAQTDVPRTIGQLVFTEHSDSGGVAAESTPLIRDDRAEDARERSLSSWSMLSTPRQRQALLGLGVLLALLAGVADGTLMVPYKLFVLQSSDALHKIDDSTVGFHASEVFNETEKLDDAVKSYVKDMRSTVKDNVEDLRSALHRQLRRATAVNDQISTLDKGRKAGSAFPKFKNDVTFVYLQGVSLGLLALSGMMWLALRLAFWKNPNKFLQHQQLCMKPGAASGVLWAFGNLCSIFASEYLGVAIGFSLTQTCSGVSAIFGIVLLREMPATSQRCMCFVGIMCLLVGTTLLAHGAH